MKEDLSKEIEISGWDEGEEKQNQVSHKVQFAKLQMQLEESLRGILLGEKIPLDVVNSETGEIIIPSNRKITMIGLRQLVSNYDRIEIDPSPIRDNINKILPPFAKRFEELKKRIRNSRILSKDTLTHWGRAEQVVVGSSYGNVTYRKWCELELKRINSKSKNCVARIVTRHGGGMKGWIALKR